MENSDKKISQQPKFMKCNNCNTVHIVIKNINDVVPTCKVCNGKEFTPVQKGVAGYMPVYCNQYLDKNVYDGVLATFLSPIHVWKKTIEDKYNITISKNEIKDLATSLTIVGKAMVNSNRDLFSNDNFVR